MSFFKTYTEFDLDENKIMKYMRVYDFTPEIKELIDKGKQLSTSCLSGKVCYDVFDIEICGEDTIDLGFAKINSKSLVNHLSECKKIVLFASTVGMSLDLLVNRYTAISPSLALCIGAVGTQAIESVCDSFCSDIEKEYGECKSRFSPGYGDVPLSLQKDIFNVLDLKKIGLTLSESLLMTPRKSVTAIIGVK